MEHLDPNDQEAFAEWVKDTCAAEDLMIIPGVEALVRDHLAVEWKDFCTESKAFDFKLVYPEIYEAETFEEAIDRWMALRGLREPVIMLRWDHAELRARGIKAHEAVQVEADDPDDSARSGSAVILHLDPSMSYYALATPEQYQLLTDSE